jgi:cytochrome b561
MTMPRSKLIAVHALAFLMLLMTWACGEAIKSEAGTPFVALYYVLHIFPGSIIFILILFEWLARNQEKLVHTPDTPTHLWVNRKLHRAYYLILLALPITGIAVFFDLMTSRPFYQLHSLLFTLLLALVLVNLCSMVIAKFKQKKSLT